MPDRPIILFPTPELAERERKPAGFPTIARPAFDRQYNRLQPTFRVLQTAFEQKNLKIQQSPMGLNPDFALVFEIVGSVDSFYTAVKNSDGLEWLFDKDSDPITPDNDFYEEDRNGVRTENTLDGKLYCIMSNQQAMAQLLSLWKRHQSGEKDVFQRGFAGLRDIFTHIKNIRKWGAQDRIAETHVVEYWRDWLIYNGDTPVPFEIELFFRSDPAKRNISVQTIEHEIRKLGGRILQECVISEIFYHGLLAELPRNAIEHLVTQYEEIQLSQVDDIMFFRPTCQSACISSTDSEILTSTLTETPLPTGTPIAAVFDGMPIQNHTLLRGRVIIDDPDDYEVGYESKYRIHGTAMTSLAIYGDLSRNDSPVGTPIYVRPVMRPKDLGMEKVEECVPADKLFIDVLHRAVKRMAEGENGNSAVAPTVKVINLSIGDPVRQLTTTMSPIARLIDFLAYKYKLLFIISAGNHPEILSCIHSSFSDMKAKSIFQRNQIFWDAIKNNQRNLKVLAPAESLNSLTVGALYDDFSDAKEGDRLIWAVEKGLPSPVSAVGKGYRGIIAPDLFYYGGRKLLKKKLDNGIDWALTSRKPGCKVAAPYSDGNDSGQAYSFGTSDAAAQLTHEAIKCYDVLKQVFYNEVDTDVPQNYVAILLKAMLAHGASWDQIADELSRDTGDGTKQLCRWVGNGIPNIDRVKECTKERITLIGRGALKKDQGDVFHLPLHIDFSTRLIKRKLTVTLAYLSPIVSNKQAYRAAQLWFNIDDGGKGLFLDGRQNSNWQAVRKGTLQHEIFMGENPIAWNNDELIIKVNCKEDAGKLHTEAIPYCVFVTFEVAEGYDIDLYTAVSTAIRPPVQVITG